MAAKLVTCEHCGGGKNCTISGGKSCKVCMNAAGMGRRRWATVRCSYCGGRGKVWVEEEDPPAEEETPTEEDAGPTDDEETEGTSQSEQE